MLQKKQREDAMAATGQVLGDQSRLKLAEQLEHFRSRLQTFAASHKDEINKNPHFRRQFHVLCQTTGVDPLASAKSFWGELLGGMNDFYYELAVQAVEVCLRARNRSGGLLRMSILHDALAKIRGKYQQEITADDIERAIQTLQVLGNGYSIVKVRGEKLVQSVPREMNADHTQILELAQDPPNIGRVTASEIQASLKWEPQRTEAVLMLLLREGVAWQDLQSDKETEYYFPSLWPSFSFD